jgi:hypothetical protein
LDVIESGNVSFVASNNRTAPTDDGGSSTTQECGALSLHVLGADRNTDWSERWQESQGHLYDVQTTGTNQSDDHPYAVDSFFLPTDFRYRVDAWTEVGRGDQVVLALSEWQSGEEFYRPYLHVQGQGATFVVNRTQESPYHCGVGLHRFGGDYAYAGAPGAPLAIASDSRKPLQTRQSTTATFMVHLYPYPPPSGTWYCHIGIEADGVRVEESGSDPVTPFCRVSYQGPPATLNLVIDRLAAYSPLIWYEVADLPPDVQHILAPDAED